MELFTATQATSIVTAVTGFVTANAAALVVVIGFGIGLGLTRGMLNKALKRKGV
jgi:hypothetical protein